MHLLWSMSIRVSSTIMIEQDIQNSIRIEASTYGSHLLRNNSGAAIDQKTGRPVRFGLGNDSKQINKVRKSSDLIGVTPYIVRPQDVGKLIGVFTAVEAKRSGWHYTNTPEQIAQLNFINIITECGGLAGFANSVEQYLALRARLGL